MERKVKEFNLLEMTPDISPNMIKGTLAVDLFNLRTVLVDENGETLLTLMNERAPKQLTWNFTYNGNTINPGIYTTIYHICVCTPDKFVMFVRSNTSMNSLNPQVKSLFLINKTNITLDTDTVEFEVIYANSNTNLFSKNTKSKFVYETDSLLKIYWIDPTHLPRVINIANRDTSTVRPLEFVPELPSKSMDVSIKKNSEGGKWSGGVVKYLITYCVPYILESNIAWYSKLYYTSIDGYGISPDNEKYSSEKFVLTITPPDSNFTHIRVYRLLYTSINNFNGYDLGYFPITKTDGNINRIIVTDEGLLNVAATPIDINNSRFYGIVPSIANNFEVKENHLLFGGYKILDNYLEDGNYFTLNNSTEYNNEIFTLDTNPSNADLTFFHNNEDYLFGILYMNKYGVWSNVVDVKDVILDKSSKDIRFNFNWTNDSIAARLVCHYPDIDVRNFVAQGVLNNTLYDRGKKGYYQSDYILSNYNRIYDSEVSYNFSDSIYAEDDDILQDQYYTGMPLIRTNNVLSFLSPEFNSDINDLDWNINKVYRENIGYLVPNEQYYAVSLSVDNAMQVLPGAFINSSMNATVLNTKSYIPNLSLPLPVYIGKNSIPLNYSNDNSDGIGDRYYYAVFNLPLWKSASPLNNASKSSPVFSNINIQGDTSSGTTRESTMQYQLNKKIISRALKFTRVLYTDKEKPETILFDIKYINSNSLYKILDKNDEVDEKDIINTYYIKDPQVVYSNSLREIKNRVFKNYELIEADNDMPTENTNIYFYADEAAGENVVLAKGADYSDPAYRGIISGTMNVSYKNGSHCILYKDGLIDDNVILEDYIVSSDIPFMVELVGLNYDSTYGEKNPRYIDADVLKIEIAGNNLGVRAKGGNDKKSVIGMLYAINGKYYNGKFNCIPLLFNGNKNALYFNMYPLGKKHGQHFRAYQYNVGYNEHKSNPRLGFQCMSSYMSINDVQLSLIRTKHPSFVPNDLGYYVRFPDNYTTVNRDNLRLGVKLGYVACTNNSTLENSFDKEDNIDVRDATDTIDKLLVFNINNNTINADISSVTTNMKNNNEMSLGKFLLYYLVKRAFPIGGFNKDNTFTCGMFNLIGLFVDNNKLLTSEKNGLYINSQTAGIYIKDDKYTDHYYTNTDFTDVNYGLLKLFIIDFIQALDYKEPEQLEENNLLLTATTDFLELESNFKYIENTITINENTSINVFSSRRRALNKKSYSGTTYYEPLYKSAGLTFSNSNSNIPKCKTNANSDIKYNIKNFKIYLKVKYLEKTGELYNGNPIYRENGEDYFYNVITTGTDNPFNYSELSTVFEANTAFKMSISLGDNKYVDIAFLKDEEVKGRVLDVNGNGYIITSPNNFYFIRPYISSGDKTISELTVNGKKVNIELFYSFDIESVEYDITDNCLYKKQFIDVAGNYLHINCMDKYAMCVGGSGIKSSNYVNSTNLKYKYLPIERFGSLSYGNELIFTPPYGLIKVTRIDTSIEYYTYFNSAILSTQSINLGNEGLNRNILKIKEKILDTKIAPKSFQELRTIYKLTAGTKDNNASDYTLYYISEKDTEGTSIEEVINSGYKNIEVIIVFPLNYRKDFSSINSVGTNNLIQRAEYISIPKIDENKRITLENNILADNNLYELVVTYPIGEKLLYVSDVPILVTTRVVSLLKKENESVESTGICELGDYRLALLATPDNDIDLNNYGDPKLKSIYGSKSGADNSSEFFKKRSSLLKTEYRKVAIQEFYVNLELFESNPATKDKIKIPLCNLYRNKEVSPIYEKSDYYNLSWNVCSDIVYKNDNKTELIADVGDCYYNTYQHLLTLPYSEETINQLVDIDEFPVESHINLLGRYDNRRTLIDHTLTRLTNFNKFNPVYSQLDNFLLGVYMNELDLYNKEFPCLIMYSMNKISGSKEDAWTAISPATGLYDTDGSLGNITGLVTNQNNLFCLHEGGLELVVFNARVQVQASDGVPIELANSKKLDYIVKITDDFGVKDCDSYINTTKSIYFLDKYTGDLCQFTSEGVIDIAKSKFNSSYFRKKDKTKLFYDINKKEIYTLSDTDSIDYSMDLLYFIGRFSYNLNGNSYLPRIDWMFNSGNNTLIANTTLLYLFNASKYYISEYSLSFVLNNIVTDTGRKISTIIENVGFDSSDTDPNGYGSTLNNGKLELYGAKPFNTLVIENDYLKGTSTNNRLVRKFRKWRWEIPRQDGSRKRIVNSWNKITLSSKNDINNILNSKAIKLYNFDIQYYI